MTKRTFSQAARACVVIESTEFGCVFLKADSRGGPFSSAGGRIYRISDHVPTSHLGS